MLILTNKLLQDKNSFTTIIQKEKSLVTSKIEAQNKLNDLIFSLISKLAFSPDNDSSLLKSLENLNTILSLSDTNLSLLNNLLKLLDKILLDLDTRNQLMKSHIAENFNTSCFEIDETLSKNNLQIQELLVSVISLSSFAFVETNTTPNEDTTNSDSIEEDTSETIAVEDSSIEEKISQNNDDNNNNTLENTLIISEPKGKVYLPYTLSSLNELLNNFPDKYSSIEDVIEKEYTLPFDYFKNPAISRFKEAFKLIHQKEHKSVTSALELGMELLFNYNLHPAIISACRTSDELDIYLDYLDNNETDKFDCFKIVFDIAPVIIENKKS